MEERAVCCTQEMIQCQTLAICVSFKNKSALNFHELSPTLSGLALAFSITERVDSFSCADLSAQ